MRTRIAQRGWLCYRRGVVVLTEIDGKSAVY